jgi:Membrane-associating domain
MILSRLISLGLRFAEFVCGAVVLGLDANFLHIHHKTNYGPFGREVYVIVLSVLSVLLSLFWMFPTISAMLHVPADLILSIGWFAAFGVLVNWLHTSGCGSWFTWGGITKGGTCHQWQAAEAFSFLNAIFWAASAIIVSLI